MKPKRLKRQKHSRHICSFSLPLTFSHIVRAPSILPFTVCHRRRWECSHSCGIYAIRVHCSRPEHKFFNEIGSSNVKWLAVWTPTELNEKKHQIRKMIHLYCVSNANSVLPKITTLNQRTHYLQRHSCTAERMTDNDGHCHCMLWSAIPITHPDCGCLDPYERHS